MLEVKAMNVVIRRKTDAITLETIAGLPAISVRTHTVPIKEECKEADHQHSQYHPLPGGHGAIERLFLLCPLKGGLLLFSHLEYKNEGQNRFRKNSSALRMVYTNMSR